jgi:hypothetical protein
MFAMIFTVIVAALVALVWAVLSSLTAASGQLQPRDPTTLELLIMAIVTLAAYAWANRLPAARHDVRFIPRDAADLEFPEPTAAIDEDAAEHAA